MPKKPKMYHGALFRNKKKQSPTSPDRNGEIMMPDGMHWLSAWDNTSQDGNTQYISVIIGDKKKEKKVDEAQLYLNEHEKSSPPPVQGDFDDDVPF